MNVNQIRILLFFVLPILALAMFPLDTIVNNLLGFGLLVVAIVGLGIILVRGSRRALTLAIFIQGLNAVVRMMLFFSHAVPSGGVADWPYIVTSLASVALSTIIMLLLDRPEVHIQMA